MFRRSFYNHWWKTLCGMESWRARRAGPYPYPYVGATEPLTRAVEDGALAGENIRGWKGHGGGKARPSRRLDATVGSDDFVRGLDKADSVAVYTFSRNLSRAATLTPDRNNAILGLRKAVAGDDTVLVIARDPAGGNALAAEFLNLADRRR